MNYQDKYKDRKPEETVEIIQKFFNSQGLYTFENESLISEIGTWSVQIQLYYNNYFITNSSGKGITKEFARASGYAELYERYVTQNNELMFTMKYKKDKENRYKKYGYYLAPDEKIITFAEATENSERIKYKVNLINSEDNLLEQWFNEIYDNKYIALPYYDLANKSKTKYYMPEMIHIACGSDGLAAGNTLEEALVQGMSEIYEHIIWDRIYDDTDIKTPCIDIFKINISEELKNKGKILLDQGYDFKVFDFSYIYNVPVIGLVLINNQYMNQSLILGAHPCFEIALERCFTEIYQNIKTYQINKKIMRPYKNIDTNYNRYFHFGNLQHRTCYNEKRLYNIEYKDNYNVNFYFNLNDTICNNIALLNYCNNINIQNNYKVYYRNFSTIDNMFAVQLFLDNYLYFTNMNYYFDKTSNIEKQQCLIFLKELTLQSKRLLEQNSFDYIKLKLMFQEYNLNLNLLQNYLYYSWDILSIYHKDNSYIKLFFNILNENNIELFIKKLTNYIEHEVDINHYLLSYFKEEIMIYVRSGYLYQYTVSGLYLQNEISQINTIKIYSLPKIETFILSIIHKIIMSDLL